MIWASREECHGPSTVGELKNFWPRWYTKNVLDTLSNFALQKNRYIVFQYKMLFRLVKDLFKGIEGLGRSVTIRVQSDREIIFYLVGIQKKCSMRYQISRSKNRCIMFQLKLVFNLVKVLLKWNEVLRRSVTARVQAGRERIFELGGIRKKYLKGFQISRSNSRYIVFQDKSFFNLVKDLFKGIKVLRRTVTAWVQTERARIFELGCIWKKYLTRCQTSRSKTRYIVFQHKLLFNCLQHNLLLLPSYLAQSHVLFLRIQFCIDRNDCYKLS